jgi:hypothetical protein
MYGRMALIQTTACTILVVQTRIKRMAGTKTNLKSISEGKGASPDYLDGSSVILNIYTSAGQTR